MMSLRSALTTLYRRDDLNAARRLLEDRDHQTLGGSRVLLVTDHCRPSPAPAPLLTVVHGETVADPPEVVLRLSRAPHDVSPWAAARRWSQAGGLRVRAALGEAALRRGEYEQDTTTKCKCAEVTPISILTTGSKSRSASSPRCCCPSSRSSTATSRSRCRPTIARYSTVVVPALLGAQFSARRAILEQFSQQSSSAAISGAAGGLHRRNRPPRRRSPSPPRSPTRWRAAVLLHIYVVCGEATRPPRSSASVEAARALFPAAHAPRLGAGLVAFADEPVAAVARSRTRSARTSPCRTQPRTR